MEWFTDIWYRKKAANSVFELILRFQMVSDTSGMSAKQLVSRSFLTF